MSRHCRLISFFFISLLMATFACDKSDRDTEKTQAQTRLLSQDFKEAFDIVRDNFLFFDPNAPMDIKDAISMRRYLHYFDQSSEYLIKDEYEAFKRAQKKVYIGVGMEIEKNDAGEIICFPFQNSPASNAGIETGDILKSVGGQKISQSTIFYVAGKLAGKDGTTVNIGILKKKGLEKMLEIERASVNYSTVTQSDFHGVSIINISSFSSSTRRELKFIIIDLDSPPALVIDLRDNAGGDFYQAIDSAMLFLDEGNIVSSIEKNGKVKQYKSTTSPLIKKTKIIIWQNENTASAAEIFTAALVENNKAVSIGMKSYGKGTSQEIFELSDGSALFLTIGYILTPLQKRYHNIGLYPTYEIKKESITTEDFSNITGLILSNDSVYTNND